MNYDRFIEDNSDALDRFIEEYHRHLNNEKDQFRFVGKEYMVDPKDIKYINENIIRVREAKENGATKTSVELDEFYSSKFREIADELEIPVEGELVIDDIARALEVLDTFARNVGEWIHCHIKYFGFIDGIDGVHRYQELLSLVHSNSQYRAIHIGAFRRMVILRPTTDIVMLIIENNKSVPFLREDDISSTRRIRDEGKIQMIYQDFFGVKYHIRLLQNSGDSILIVPAYMSRKGYSPSLLEESFLYAED